MRRRRAAACWLAWLVLLGSASGSSKEDPDVTIARLQREVARLRRQVEGASQAHWRGPLMREAREAKEDGRGAGSGGGGGSSSRSGSEAPAVRPQPRPPLPPKGSLPPLPPVVPYGSPLPGEEQCGSPSDDARRMRPKLMMAQDLGYDSFTAVTSDPAIFEPYLDEHR